MKLSDPVGNLPFVGPVYVQRLKKLDIDSIEDLLLHVPHRYIDFSNVTRIQGLMPGQNVTIKGEVTAMINQYTRTGKKIQIAEIEDNYGKINLIWFNQPFLIRSIRKGETISAAGEIGWFGRKLAIISPEYEKSENNEIGIHTGRLIPIYPETKGISSKWLRNRIAYAYKACQENILDYIPQSTLKELDYPPLLESIKGVHFPKNINEAEKCRVRLAFNELLSFQLRSLYKKIDWEKNEAVQKLKINKKLVREFISSLPFELTTPQNRSVNEILSDLSQDSPMNRLLEGDVGSGKTVVAAIACFMSFLNGYQSVLMAPTQILANQHFETLKDIFNKFKVRIALITSEGVQADYGKIDIFVGTHALIHNRVNFDNVALVVIDEQHKFGVKQRAHLVRTVGKKKTAPHVLTMTATPIPRSVALTAYGDLDLSVLDELPYGRIPITTWIIPPKKRESAYNWIRDKIIKEGVQVFVICPLIEESTVETMKTVKAVTSEYDRLKKIFSDHNVGLLHGRQKSDMKSQVLSKFKKGKVDILVSTPVVEVGIDVTNANIMVVEASERFGLAQLHQLRGRVGRGDKKAYCLLFTESSSKKVNLRLLSLKKEKSGFKLAEIDLKIRGPGEVFGFKQHGFPELKIATWQNVSLIKKSKEIATEAINKPKKYHLLLKKLTSDIAPN